MCKTKNCATAMTGQKVTSGALKVPLSTSPWLPIALLWASELSEKTDKNSG